MCGSFSIDDLETIASAREAADEMLGVLRVPITKALDLSTGRGFDQAVGRLAHELRRLVHTPETEAVRNAVRALDVDWRKTTAAERRTLIARALEAAGRATATVPSRIEARLGRAATTVFNSTRSDARRRHELTIAADFNAVDRRAIGYVTRAHSLFVRDEYGRRLDAFGEDARRVVGRGLELGLGRDDIARDLAAAAEKALVRRSNSYWDVVAAAFVGESRSLSQLSSYAEAGIERFVITAVLDEVTTDGCRFLDGKILQTADGLRAFERLEAADDPLAIKRERPWVRERVGEDGKRALVVTRDDTPTVLAVIERSGIGARDDRGSYSRALSSRDLAPAGVGMPPYHGLCRTTTIPDV